MDPERETTERLIRKIEGSRKTSAEIEAMPEFQEALKHIHPAMVCQVQKVLRKRA